MTELETRMRELGAAFPYPPTPDLAPAVGARLRAAAPRRPPRVRRRIALAAAGLVLLLAGSAFAFPGARDDVLEWLGLKGVRVEHVPELPPTPPGPAGDLGLGASVTLAEARREVAFRVLRPRLPGLGAPDEVYVSRPVPGGQVALVYRPGSGIPASRTSGVGLLLLEFQGSADFDLVQKEVGPATRVERATVNGGRGAWVEGPHRVRFGGSSERPRIADATLLWEAGDVTLRLEGRLSKRRALGIARSVR
jgi:hypothetical protein